MLVMVNTNMTHVFKHPKFYRIPRDKSDQVISSRNAATAAGRRAPGPGPNRKARTASRGGRAPGYITFFKNGSGWCVRYDKNAKRQATSVKHQAPIFRKLQAPSTKRQAFEPTCSSIKRQASQP